jgi:hypothetical protein
MGLEGRAWAAANFSRTAYQERMLGLYAGLCPEIGQIR